MLSSQNRLLALFLRRGFMGPSVENFMINIGAMVLNISLRLNNPLYLLQRKKIS